VRLWSGEGLSGEALGDVLTGIENLRGSALPTRWWATTAMPMRCSAAMARMRFGPGTATTC
jgi:hypothetical protein